MKVVHTLVHEAVGAHTYVSVSIAVSFLLAKLVPAVSVHIRLSRRPMRMLP
jgi:hypothetical protein